MADVALVVHRVAGGTSCLLSPPTLHLFGISLSDKTFAGPMRLPCYFYLFSVTQQLLPAAEVEIGLASKVNISHSFLINYIKYSHSPPPQYFLYLLKDDVLLAFSVCQITHKPGPYATAIY